MTSVDIEWGKIITWVVVWLVGYVLGLLESRVKLFAKDKEVEKLKSRISTLEKTPPPAPPAPKPVMDDAALSVYELPSGAVRLRIDKVVLNDKTQLDAEKRSRLLSVVMALRPWLEQKVQAVPAVSPPPKAAKRVDVSFSSSPAEKDDENEEITLDSAEFARLSMSEQIDRILQRNLAGTPLDKHGISLRPSLSGGITFHVGLRQYEWLDEIPDAEVVAVIKAAIAEWEDRVTPH